MTIQQLLITGLRGFAETQKVEFATPNGEPGSGMTVLVGPNGGGKSTVLEALRAAALQSAASFSLGQRNHEAGDAVEICWISEAGTGVLRSVRRGSSETVREGDAPRLERLVHLPSRRSFNPYFGESIVPREVYAGGYQIPNFRAQPVDLFAGRLLKIERTGPRPEFDRLVQDVAGSPLDWSIDRQDTGHYFLKVRKGAGSHSSDGLGEGTVSLLFLADALYDSSPGDAIVIDEPELSLHPLHQRRVRAVLSRYSADRQIILATHSPYFVDWHDLLAGGTVHRIHPDSAGKCTVSSARRATIAALGGIVADMQNPHVLGLNASEVFFIEDHVILTEGQEDVLYYQAMAREVGVDLTGSFFGWGVGGADKMPRVVQLLVDLGYESVVGILDGNRAEQARLLKGEFELYDFHVIPASDVRSKPERPRVPAVHGLADHAGHVLPEHREAVIQLFEAVNSSLLQLSGRTS